MKTGKTIALISCVSMKLDKKAKVKDIYISPLFKKNLEYARNRNTPDESIFILSALHGLIGLEEEIDPYDVTLIDMSTREKNQWARKVFKQIQNHPDIPDLKEVKFIILAGMNYRETLEPVLPNVEMPLLGLPIGRQLEWLSKENKRLQELKEGA